MVSMSITSMLRTPDKAGAPWWSGRSTAVAHIARQRAAAAAPPPPQQSLERTAPPARRAPRTQVLQQLAAEATRADDQHLDVVLQHGFRLLAWLEAWTH